MASLAWMLDPAQAGLALLGESSLRGVVLLGAAWAACRLLRRRSAAVRHLIWALSLAAMVAAPGLLDLAPKVRVPALWRPLVACLVPARRDALRRPAATVQPALPAAARLNVAADLRTDVPSSDRQITEPSLASRSEGSWTAAAPRRPNGPAAASPKGDWLPTLLLGIWAVGFSISVVRLGIGHWRVRKMARGAALLDAAELDVTAPAKSLPRRRSVRFLQSRGEAMPMTWGWRRPVVLLPASFGNWDRERRHMTLFHELAHVGRADWLTQTLAHLAGAVYWFHPLVWLALNRMRIEADRACDDMVLRAGVKPSGYAGHLVQAAREFRTAGLRPWVAIAMAQPSSLNHRVAYVLDEKVVRTGLGRSRGLALALGMTLAILTIPSIEAGGQAEAPAGAAIQETKPAAPASARETSETLPPAPRQAADEAALQAAAEKQAALADARARMLLAQNQDADRQRAEDAAVQRMEEKARRAAEAAHRAAVASRFRYFQSGDAQQQARLSPQAMQTAAAALRKALGSAEAKVRAEAAEALGRLGSPEQANLEALSKALSDSEPQVQRNAVESLGRLLRLNRDIASGDAVHWLQPALGSPDASVRREAAGALGRLRGQAAIDAAIQLVGDADPEVQREAIEALGRLLRSSDEQAARAALPVFQKAMQDDDPQVRRQLVETLGSLHSIADEVVPLLAKAAEDPDPDVQREAVEALGKISSPEAGLEFQIEDHIEDFVENGADTAPWAHSLKDLQGKLADIPHQLGQIKK